MKVFGALRLVTKMLLMLNSVIQIDGEGNPAVPSSVLEVRNLAVLRVYLKILSCLFCLIGWIGRQILTFSSCRENPSLLLMRTWVYMVKEC